MAVIKFNFLLLFSLYLTAVTAQNNQPVITIFVQNNTTQTTTLPAVPFIRQVTDETIADIVLTVGERRIGNGQTQPVYQLAGRGQFSGITDSIPGGAGVTMQPEALKRGLLPFLLQTDYAEQIQYQLPSEADYALERDGWNLWTYNITLDGNYTRQTFQDDNPLSGQSDLKLRDLNLTPRVSMYRTGEKWKASLNLNIEYDTKSTAIKDPTRDTTETDRQLRTTTTNYFSYSLGEHWSVGVSGGGASQNSPDQPIDVRLFASLGAEYNIFSFRDYFKKRLIVAYYPQLTKTFVWFDGQLLSENQAILQHKLLVNAALIKEWGYATTSLQGTFNHTDFANVYGASLNFGLGVNLNKHLYLFINQNFSSSRTVQNFQFNGSKPRFTISGTNTSFGITWYLGSGYRNVVNPVFR